MKKIIIAGGLVLAGLLGSAGSASAQVIPPYPCIRPVPGRGCDRPVPAFHGPLGVTRISVPIPRTDR